MAKANCYEKDGSKAGTFELPAALFDGEVNEALVHQAVVAYQANQRQGTASAKGRSEVNGGGAKPFRQKGTGRARAGTIRSPIWRGGGVVFGPHPRDYTQKQNRKARRAAVRSALTSRAAGGDVVVIKSLEFAEPKTSAFAGILKSMDLSDLKTLVVIAKSDANTVKSARNIKRVKVTLASGINTYDVLWADKIIMTAAAVEKSAEVFAS